MKNQTNLKMKIKTSLFLLITSLVTAGLCAAQTEAGHGGNAVYKDGHYYLLDLVEAGSETSGTLDLGDHSPDCYREPLPFGNCLWRTHDFSTIFGAEVNRGLRNAANELPNFEGLTILNFISLFDWNFVEIPLIDLRDVNTPVDLKNYPMYQLAIRRDHTITINALIWKQLDALNKVALVMHEMLYTLVRPQPDPAHPGIYFQDSYTAREFNAEIFKSIPHTDCTECTSKPSPRMRAQITNQDFSFSLYTASFGTYGEADDYIGHDVETFGELVNRRYVSTGAYVKIEGAVTGTHLPGTPADHLVREKLSFFKEEAVELCKNVFQNTPSGKPSLKISLVRTLFTEQLGTYNAATGLSKYAKVIPTELTFSDWYHHQQFNDVIQIDPATGVECVNRVKAAGESFERLMKDAPDFSPRWLDAH